MGRAGACVVVVVVVVGVLVLLLGRAGAELTSAQQECVAPLQALLGCLPYAQGTASLPTPGCCRSMAQVYRSHERCLCELIAASIDGASSSDLPPFNETLAFAMPSLCSVRADPKDCPGLLGLSPSSTEAKVFNNHSLSSSPSATATNSTSSSNTINGGGIMAHYNNHVQFILLAILFFRMIWQL